jgi:hypothetical protein
VLLDLLELQQVQQPLELEQLPLPRVLLLPLLLRHQVRDRRLQLRLQLHLQTSMNVVLRCRSCAGPGPGRGWLKPGVRSSKIRRTSGAASALRLQLHLLLLLLLLCRSSAGPAPRRRPRLPQTATTSPAAPRRLHRAGPGPECRRLSRDATTRCPTTAAAAAPLRSRRDVPPRLPAGCGSICGGGQRLSCGRAAAATPLPHTTIAIPG